MATAIIALFQAVKISCSVSSENSDVSAQCLHTWKVTTTSKFAVAGQVAG